LIFLFSSRPLSFVFGAETMADNVPRHRLLYYKVMRSLRSFTLWYGKLALLFAVRFGFAHSFD
jgi:hypothetical protein